MSADPANPARPPRTVPCPRCGQPALFAPSNRARPFCSERCKLIDLGAWASGAYRIDVSESPDPGHDLPAEHELDAPPPRRRD
jgi:endogenous inhibitor of DNA gyrase (YacG/DUF329 family)